MIVLPLNEEARSGRRPPWVTLVLIAACVLVFLHHRGSDRTVDERTDAALDEAWEYFVAHPYVKVEPDLAAMLGEDEVAFASQTFLQELRAASSPGIPDFVRLHDQVEFDRRVEHVYEAMEEHSFYRLGFFPEAMSAPDASFLTYVLVHEDWLHLLSNLALVLLAGLFLEEVWGRGLYLAFLVTGAVAGAVGYATLDPDAVEALGGASGLAAALAGAFLVRFATVPIRFQYFVIPPFGGKFTARGWVTLPIYGGLYFVADYILTQGAPGLEPVGTEFATWAHVGGFAWGFAFALAMKAARIEERFIHPKIERKLTTRSNPMLDRALEAREAGRAEEAFELLAREVSRRPNDRDAALAFWDAASAVDRPEQAAGALARVLRGEVTAGQKELALQHWRELTQRAPDFPVESTLETRITALLIEAGEHDLASFSAQRLVEGRCGAVAGATAHKLARIVQDLDTGLALAAARRALAAKDLDAAEAQEVQRLVEQLERARESAASQNDTTGGYERDDRSLALDEARGAEGGAGGPDLDGDTLNAEPFELDDLTAPPGVRSVDLEGDAAAVGEATAPGLEAPLPGVAEIALDDGTAPPALDDATGPSIGGGTSSPFDAGNLPPLGAATAPRAEADTTPPSGDATGPSLRSDTGAPFDAGDLPPLDGSEVSLEEAPDLDALDLSSPDLSAGSHDFGPVAPVVGGRPTRDLGETTRPPAAAPAEPGRSLPGLEREPRDLGASLPDPGESHGPGASLPGLGDESHGPGASLPGLGDESHGDGASLPGLGDDVPGLEHGAMDLGESTPDLGLSTPPSAAPGDDSIPLVDEPIRPRRRPSPDDTGAPDFGNTIDLSSLGAETIPGYGADDLPAPPRRPAPAPPREAPGRPAPPPASGTPGLEAPRPPRTLKKMEAIPLALGDESVTVDVGERGKAQLALARIDAIAVAGVRGLRPKPIVVIDLVTNWLGEDRQPLKIVRLRSDRFDPCSLVPDEPHGFKALKQWIGQLIEATGALALPDPTSAVGAPFRMYDDLAEYEREVLRVL